MCIITNKTCSIYDAVGLISEANHARKHFSNVIAESGYANSALNA